jgi:hypothetical protein
LKLRDPEPDDGGDDQHGKSEGIEMLVRPEGDTSLAARRIVAELIRRVRMAELMQRDAAHQHEDRNDNHFPISVLEHNRSFPAVQPGRNRPVPKAYPYRVRA